MLLMEAFLKLFTRTCVPRKFGSRLVRTSEPVISVRSRLGVLGIVPLVLGLC